MQAGAIGISRAVYNTYVAASRMASNTGWTGAGQSCYDLARELNKLKHDNDEFRLHPPR